ncbi:hypothetical protein B296_00050490 [Ensete ventricosum]|uniref:Uncharacterized protein n=1 Tax=Ensete ventricosum TaxID=4639 RepID=A0A426Y0N1_ENSVE|nr:hypothetical protein B296_00050490 [Ensete ventricosum]
MFLSPNEGSASGGQRAPPEIGCVMGGTSSPGLTGVERSRDIGGPSSSAKCCGCSTASRESAQRGSGRLHKRGPMQAVRGWRVWMRSADGYSCYRLRVAYALLSCGSLKFL